MTTAYAKLNFQQNKQCSLCFNLFISEKLFLIIFSSLKEVWVAVINITGPLSNWSFADHSLPGNVKNPNFIHAVVTSTLWISLVVCSYLLLFWNFYSF